MVFKFHSWFADESAATSLDRFPLPWVVEEQSGCFVLRDYSGQALAYVYYEEPGRPAAKLLSRDEARRIAANIAKLPELLRKAE